MQVLYITLKIIFNAHPSETVLFKRKKILFVFVPTAKITFTLQLSSNGMIFFFFLIWFSLVCLLYTHTHTYEHLVGILVCNWKKKLFFHCVYHIAQALIVHGVLQMLMWFQPLVLWHSVSNKLQKSHAFSFVFFSVTEFQHIWRWFDETVDFFFSLCWFCHSQ